MPKRAQAEYMRSYRLRRKLAAVEGPDADWRRMHPSAALVELARSLPDMEPDDGEGIIPPRPGTLTAPDARWSHARPAERVLLAHRGHRRNPHARVLASVPRRAASGSLNQRCEGGTHMGREIYGYIGDSQRVESQLSLDR